MSANYKKYEKGFDLNLLRNWSRSSLRFLKLFVDNDLVTHQMIANFLAKEERNHDNQANRRPV